MTNRNISKRPLCVTFISGSGLTRTVEHITYRLCSQRDSLEKWKSWHMPPQAPGTRLHFPKCLYLAALTGGLYTGFLDRNKRMKGELTY